MTSDETPPYLNKLSLNSLGKFFYTDYRHHEDYDRRLKAEQFNRTTALRYPKKWVPVMFSVAQRTGKSNQTERRERWQKPG